MMRNVLQSNGFGLPDHQAEHPFALRRRADVHPGEFVDTVRDELAQLLIAAPHRERTVAGIDQTGRRAHDGVQRLIQIESVGDREHGFHQPVDTVTGIDDLLDPILDLGQ